MIKYLNYLVASLLVATPLSASAWQSVREGDRVTVFSQTQEGSALQVFRAETEVDAPPAQALALIKDTAACVDWMHTCKSPKLIREVSAEERFTYMEIDLPWPVKDRALTMHATVSPVEGGGVLVSLLNKSAAELAPADAANLPRKSSAVPVESALGFFKLVPLPGDRCRVVYQLQLNPGGGLPAGVVNSRIEDNVFNTLKNMQTAVLNARYRG